MSADPSACRWCGLSKEGHMSQWNPTVGWHTWTEPTTEQRYEAIRSNAAERRPASGMPHTPAPGCTCHPTDPFEDDTEESGHAE